ncbi:MAG TPA: hypothetical protein VG055_16445 [Planctomycetaceae bacterium]|nr:hypothetical protein [Planctomycetaceae bacterium]
MANPTQAVLNSLSSSGLLLKQDKLLPNVVTLVTGESLRTSWWSHPKGRLIFAVLADLADHPDVLFVKLLFGKDTLVHRRLWPALLAVATAEEPWQWKDLSAAGRKLLATLNETKGAVRSSGATVKEIETRLLAHSEQVHTESGRHETVLEPWSVWKRRVRVKPLRSQTASRAALGRQRIEEAVAAIGAPLTALPWAVARRLRPKPRSARRR